MKRYLLIIMMMVCAVTGAWAGADVSINTKEETDPTKWEGTDALGYGCPTSVTVIGAINQAGLDYIQNRCAGNGDYGNNIGKIPLTLSGATLDGDVSSFGEGFGKVILPADCDASKYSYSSYLKYAISQGTPTYIYAASGTTLNSITELTTPLSGSFIVSGPGKSALETEITSNGGTLAFDGYATVAAGNVVSDIAALKTAQSISETDITNLTITAGNLTSEETTYIKETLTNVGFLDISAATVSANDIYELLACGHITSITLSDAQKTALKSVSGKTFTADLLSKAGMTVDDLVTGMTTANYIVDGTTLIVTGNIDSTVDTQIASVLSTYNTVTTLDVSKATNTTNYEIAEKTGITLVKLPGSGKVTYAGNATVLTNGSLTIAIGNDAREYASVSDALTALSTTLSSSDVQHVKVTGALSTEDLGNIHSLGSNVETIDLSEATLANGAAWTDLTGDFSNAGVLLPTGAIPGATTNANIFTINGNFLTATKNVAETFDAELAFFSETTGKTLLTTSGTTAIISGVLDNTALANISSLTEYTRIDLSGATIATGASIDNLQIPSALEQLVLPKDQTVSSTLATTLAAATNLWYAYSPSSDCSATGPNQTDSYDGTKNTIADYVWVVKADGLAKAFTNEEQLRNSFYIKVASSVALSNTDVDFNGLDANKPTNYLFLDFSESNLTPSVAAHYTVTDDIGYRIILPDGWTGDQMAVFAALPQTAASGPARGNIAAVYSYNGTRLDIMEITDDTYMTTALSNPRIVRAGTTALQVVSGSYNGSVYSACGDNLIAAINGAQSSITSVKINTGKNFLNNTTYAANFTNPNITSLDLSGIDITYGEINNLQGKSLSVKDCSKLQTLNLSNAAIGSVDAAVSSLTNVNLTGTSIYGDANFSGASLTTAFTTTSATSFFGTLTLTNTGLTAFSTAAKVSGDINLSGSSSLASVNLLQTQFKDQWKNPVVNSKIHVHKTNDEKDTSIIETLKVSESIQVPTDFNKDNKRICPYDAASSYIKEAEYIAPACEFTDTDMYLHEPEEAANGDKLVYWYQGDMRTGEVANINVSTTNSLATTITNNAKLGTGVVKAKIAGDVSSTDVASLKDINATVLDLSQATFDETAWTALKTAFAAKGTGLHANTKFVILPSTATREDIINPTALAGLTNIWSVIATKENNTATNNVMHQPLGNGYDFTSYTRVAGTLQAATVQTLTSSTADYTRTPNIGGTPTSKRVYLSNVSNFRDLKISGIVNAYDLCKSTTVDQNGHLKWNRAYTEAAIEPAGRTLVGQDVYGPFGSCFNLTAIDLEYATFVNDGTTDYVTDMTLSALNVLSANATKKVVIPTDASVKVIPADFMNSSIAIDAICIPYNIERICSRAFNTIDYVWTTSWTGSSAKDNTDPEGANTKLDNGAEYTSGDIVTLAYATNWDGDKQVKSDFDYTLEPTGGSYTFSSNLKVIESGAFANTRPHVKDVYVLNAVAPECHVDAFNTNMYVGNGGYDPVIEHGIITRDSYKNGGFWITMLHYPRQTVTPNVQRYTDPTRSYSIATGDRDGKGGTLYYPNQSEFIRAYTQGTYGYTWNAWNPAREYGSVNNGAFANLTLSAYNSTDQANANTNFNTYTTGGDNHKYTSFYDLTANGTTTKPSTIVDYDKIYWDESSYSTSGTPAQQLYPQSKDYRGWHQFVLNAYASNTILDVEEFRSYITDNEWWTFCPTFDITRKQAITLFGTPKVEAQEAVGNPEDENYKPAVEAVAEQIPFISKLLYVRRDYDSNTIALNFSKNLMLKKEDRENSTVSVTKEDNVITAVENASQHGRTDDKGVYIINETPPADDDVVMSAGVPYMIKPHMPNGNIRLFQIYATQDEADKMIKQYKDAGRDMSTLPFKYIVDETLYGVMLFAQERSGTKQRELVESGLYSVPVFVKGTAKSGVTKESTDGIEYTISNVKYNKSTQWKYSFVGSFYQSFLPGNCYFLGWDSKNKCAKFFYNDKPDANVMRWTNETGVICPTAPGYTFTITPASGKDPAQWKIGKTIGEKTTDEKYGIETYWLSDDSFSTSGGSTAKTYDQFFDSPEVFSVVVDGIGQIYSSKTASTSENVTVYSIDGQLVGKSLRGLPKGIYVVDGKKYVVK